MERGTNVNEDKVQQVTRPSAALADDCVIEVFVTFNRMPSRFPYAVAITLGPVRVTILC